MVRVVPDVVSPLTVTAIDLVTETYAPDYNEAAAYVVAIGGYIAAAMGWGGDFVKNMGISSFPWAAKKIYERVKGGAGARKMTYRRSGVSRYPGSASETEFRGRARLV